MRLQPLNQLILAHSRLDSFLAEVVAIESSTELAVAIFGVIA
jgi:hypothetical protein